HRLVDLEKFPVFARLGSAGQRAGAEPDHRHLQRRSLALADRGDRLPDAAVLVVVGDRLGPPDRRRAVIVLEFFSPVYSGAVHQPVKRSLPPGGRHKAASASRIGYSATQEKVKGAIRPANRPPIMPPKDNAT